RPLRSLRSNASTLGALCGSSRRALRLKSLLFCPPHSSGHSKRTSFTAEFAEESQRSQSEPHLIHHEFSVSRPVQKISCIATTFVVVLHTLIGDDMGNPRLSKLELQIMDVLWTRGSASIREIQESFPEKRRPAYTTIQTTVYRLETKKAVSRLKKVGNF